MLIRSSIFGASTIAIAALGAAPGHAQQAGVPVEVAAAAAMQPGIIVTGQYQPPAITSATKTQTPLIDIPQSLSVISREQLDDQMLTDLGDVLRYTPGASIGQGEGHRDQITIRGQNTTADFFVDGIRDDVQYFRPLYNLERVEILRGSNALIFGRGGGGGVINRVTKTAVIGETFGSASASVDSFGSTYLSGDVNTAVSANLGLRLNAFYEGLGNHRDFYSGDRFAFNPTFAFAPGANTRIEASYEYIDDDRSVDRGVPASGGAPLMGFDNTFFGSPEFNLTRFEGHVVRARLTHDFSESLSFNQTVQYGDYDKLYQNVFATGFDAAAGTVTFDGYRDTTGRENFIAQGNLVWEGEAGGLGHTLLLGYEYGDQQTANGRRNVFFQASQDNVVTFPFSDPLALPAFSFPAVNRDTTSDAQFLSFYAQEQLSIGDHIILIGGIRYDRFDLQVIDAIEVADGPGDGNDGILGRVDHVWSPRAGLIVKPIENLSLYASYSRSFLPRSGDQFLSLTPSQETLAPERFDNYEIGVKWDPIAELSLTAAVFRLDRENGTTPDPANPGNAILTGSRTEGFEFQLVGRLLPGWQINAGYSYLDADERGRVVGGVLANREIAQVPEHMVSLWSRYDISERFGFGAGLTHQSSQFASIGNSVRLPGYTRVDAAIYYVVSDNIELQLNVENLFDEDYFPAAHNDNNISTGEPLNARLTARVMF